MVKERALMLKSQEEKMGAFIATLQMNKAREVGSFISTPHFIKAAD